MERIRLNYVDIGRFVAMSLIVLLHVLQRTYPHFTSTWFAVFALVLGVAPFFFFSGLVYSNKAPLRPVGFVYDLFKRAFAYFLPFIWFLLFRVLLYGQWVDFPAAFSANLDYPVTGLWVCWILMWLVVLVDIGLLFSHWLPRFKTAFVTAMIVIGYVTIIILRKTYVLPSDHFLGYDYFIIYTPVFLLGYLAGKHMYKFNNKIISLVCLFIGVGGLIPIAIFNPVLIEPTFLTGKWMFFLGCGCAVMAIYGLTSLLRNYRWAEVFAKGGRYTMEMYFLHLMLLKNWSNLGLENGWAIFGMTIGLYVLCVVNTAVATVITHYVPFLHFALFGRHYSRYAFENALFEKLSSTCLSK